MPKIILVSLFLLTPTVFGAGDVRPVTLGPPFALRLESGSLVWFHAVEEGKTIQCGPENKGERLQCGKVEFELEYELEPPEGRNPHEEAEEQPVVSASRRK